MIYVVPKPSFGKYASAMVTKELTILGPSGAVAFIEKLDVIGAPSVTLCYLATEYLTLKSVPGQAVIESVYTGGQQFGTSQRPFYVYDCADVRIARSNLRGNLDGSVCFTALTVEGASNVQVVDSTLTGLDAFADSFNPGWGGDALDVQHTSTVMVAGSSLIGGNGHNYFDIAPGHGGDAVRLQNAAVVEIRGNASNVLHGGLRDILSPPMPALDGRAVECWWTATGHATVDGVTLEGLLGPCASIAGEVRPFLTTGAAGSTGALGQPWAAKVFGGAGAFAVLVASLGSAQLELPIIETTPLWLSPTQVIATVGLTLAGVDTPVEVGWTQPLNPAFLGLVIHLQGFEISPSGSVRGTNAALSVLNY